MDVVYCSAITADAGQIALSYRSSRPAAHAYRRHSTKQSTDYLKARPAADRARRGLTRAHWRTRRIGRTATSAMVADRDSDQSWSTAIATATVGVLALTCCDDRCQRRRNHATTGRLNGQTRPGSPTNPGFPASLYASRARNLLQVLNGVWTRLAPPARPHLPPAISGRGGGASHAQPLIIFPHSLIKFPRSFLPGP